MTVDDLPDAHVRFVFATILFLDGMLTEGELRSEVIVAFGRDAGAAIADHILALRRPLGLR